jgi:CRP-like cAMP-binding protein
MVLDGQLALRRSTPDGRQVIVRIAARGNLSTMLPLATLPTAVDSIALTQTLVAIWRASEVRALAASDPGLAVALLDQALAALAEVTARLEGLLSQGALQRVARVLRRHADLFFAEMPVLTRGQLPMFVGTSREMTGRVLRTLEARGLVARIGRNGLRLIDPVGLAALADNRDERGREPA